jgi:zinc transport system permease protein
MWEMLQYEFMRNALLAGALASIACGIVGVYVIVKRIVFISGGVSHSAFGGIGFAYLLDINPILGALFFTLISAFGIGLISKKTKQREDTAIGILWAVAMALGVIFTSLSPGYPPDPSSILFGSILTVPRSEILMMLILDVFIISVVLLLYKEFMAISFDEEFAKVVGVPTERVYLVLLALIAMTVVMLIRVVGVILVIALLTIPAAISGQITRSLKKMMFLSILLGVIFTFCGLWLSYVFDLASGATIVLVSGTTFLFSSLSGIVVEARKKLDS